MSGRKANPKLCLVCTRGGHLAQMLKLERVFAHRPHFLITTKSEGQQEELTHFRKIYFVADINENRWLKNPFKFVLSVLQTLRIFIAERPEFLISTGSGIAVPAFLLARLFGTKSVFVEDCARTRSVSWAGIVCYRLGNLFFVQHPGLVKKLPRAIYAGALYGNLDF